MYDPGVSSIRVLLADDHLLIRSGVETLIALEPDIDIIHSCATLDELLASALELVPDVVVTDLRMPPAFTDEGLQAARLLREIAPDIGVIILTQHVDSACALALVEQGSRRRGYLLKEHVSSSDLLAGAIRAVASGGSYIDPTVVDEMFQAKVRTASPLRQLSARECEVLAAMATGRSNAAIALQLFVGERAVEKHISAIFLKLGLYDSPDSHRRVQAVMLYLASSP